MYGLILWWQRLLVWASYTRRGLALLAARQRTISWVVGVDEIPSVVIEIARVDPGSYSASFQRLHRYAYDAGYRYSIAAPVVMSRHARIRTFVGLLLLGRLTHEARGIIYVGGTGFLAGYEDARDYEMKWAMQHGHKVVCYWAGSDMWSLRRMKELETELQRPNIATYIAMYIALVALGIESCTAKDSRRRFTVARDRWSYPALSNSVGHLGERQTSTEPFLYCLAGDRPGDGSQYDEIPIPVLVQASTSPDIKGTPLVRSAIAKVRADGHEFEYVELMGVTNDVVISHLRRAYVVRSQFYGFSSVVFGVEGLCAGTVMMFRSDETLETGLAAGSDDTWVVTAHYEAYDNGKRLLDAPETWRPIAQRGLEWERRYGTASGVGIRVSAVLDNILHTTYELSEQP